MTQEYRTPSKATTKANPPVLRQETGEKRKPRAGQLGIGAQTRFKLGQSGNPGGRPTKFLTIVSDAVRDTLAEIDPETGQTHAMIIGRGLTLQISKACKAKLPLDRQQLMLLKELLDRAEGRPEQRLSLTPSSPEEDEDPEEIVARLLAIAAERVAASQS